MGFFDWLKPKSSTVEETISLNSVGMTNAQKSEYWYILNKSLFNLLGKVEPLSIITPITPDDWIKYAKMFYPTLTDIKIPDTMFYTCDLWSMRQILTKDWSNLVPYIIDKSDCDKFAIRLYEHLCTFYGITSALPVWGMTTSGYHGFNIIVLAEADGYAVRLIEPQTDSIFVVDGPLGKYMPDTIADFLAVKPLSIR